MGINVTGNGWLFCLFLSACSLLFLMGLALVGAGAYLFYMIQEVIVFNLAACIVGAIMTLFAFSGCCLRTGECKLICYNTTITVLWALDVALTTAYWVKQDYVVLKFVEFSQDLDDVFLSVKH